MSLKCYIISLLVPIHCLNSLSFPHQLSSPYHLSEVGTSLFFCLQSLFESGAVNWTPANLMTKKNIFSCKTEEKKKTVMCALMLVYFMSFQPVHAILLVLFSFSMKEWIFSGVFPGATLSRRSCGKFCGCTTHQVDIKTIEPWNQKHQFIGLILTSRSLTTQPSLLDRQRWAESLNRCSTGKIILLSGSSVFSDSFIGLIISLLLLIQNAMLIPLAVSCLALS